MQAAIDSFAAQHGFSGAVRVDVGDRVEVEGAYGYAHRALGIPNAVDTQFAVASGTKGLTALTVASLVEDGTLRMATTARSVLGSDLPLIRDDVTIQHLLAHRSGIGDYVDEEEDLDLSGYLMPIPVHELATTEHYLAVLDGHTTKFLPGERFGYCNGGYVVLALVAERSSGVPFHELVRARVCEPAGMSDTAFLRSDELSGRAALGYVTESRANVLHLPVRGSGDGGIYTTLADVSALWRALFDGRIVSLGRLAEMTRPHSDVPDTPWDYGLGFWLGESGEVMLEGADAGVSFRSVHDPARATTRTVVSNTSDGAWPVAALLAEWLIRSG